MQEDFVIDIGDTVVCDWCNADYTDSPESGGVLVGSYAVCPQCEGRVAPDEVDVRCPTGVPFRDWVLDLRGGDNTIRITSF